MVIFLLMLLALGQEPARLLQESGVIAPTQIRALILAVEDEVYDNGFEEDYIGAGKNEAESGQKWVSRMPIYVDPIIDQGEGRAIYNLKHYGEVYRLFYIHEDGTIALDGDPELGFPRTDTSFLTRYMSRKRLAHLKQGWLHERFVINTEPGREVVREAAVRQKQRTGFSYWETVVLPHLHSQ
jgi:hypothetical protein